MIEILNLTAGEFWQWLGGAVAHGTALALLTWMLIRWPLARAHSALHGMLWLIVLIKFAVPIGPGLSWSLASGLSQADDWFLAAPVAPRTPPDVLLALPALGIAAGAAAAPVAAELAQQAPRALSWAALLALAYLGIAALIALVRLTAYRRFLHGVRQQPLADEAICAVVRRVSARLGIAMPRVRVSDLPPAPFIVGFFRPTLVLARQHALDMRELEAVVVHELAHVRRADLLVRCLQWLVGTLLFFWPVVAWVNRRIDLVREMACDEWALRHGQLSASQYARCLLRAVQPVQPAPVGLFAAAMAANPSHVERRIEVILHTNAPTRRRWLLPLSVAALGGWSTFVLTGAASPIAALGDEECKDMVILQVEQETNGGADGEMLMPAMIMPLEGDEHVAFATSDEADEQGARKHVAVSMLRGPSAATLAKFAESYPTADANHDGTLSRAEYDAYHAALALADTAAVLARYPKADLNGDAALDANEAARLVTVPPIPAALSRWRTKVLGGATDADAAGGVKQRRIVVRTIGDDATVEGDVQPGTRVIRMRGDGAEAGAAEAMSMIKAEGPAAAWLIKNISATPSAAEVARLTTLVTEAPLAAFLESNPKADTNGDGRLTVEERHAFLQERVSKAHAKLLEKFPQADADGDGKLSKDEIHAHLRAQHGDAAGGGTMIIKERVSNADGGEEINVEVRSADKP